MARMFRSSAPLKDRLTPTDFMNQLRAELSDVLPYMKAKTLKDNTVVYDEKGENVEDLTGVNSTNLITIQRFDIADEYQKKNFSDENLDEKTKNLEKEDECQDKNFKDENLYKKHKNPGKVIICSPVNDFKPKEDDSVNKSRGNLEDALLCYATLRKRDEIEKIDRFFLPICQIARGREHYVLIVIKNDKLRLIDSKSDISFYPSSDFKKRVSSLLNELQKKHGIEIKRLPAIYTEHQDFLDDHSCGHFAKSYILQLSLINFELDEGNFYQNLTKPFKQDSRIKWDEWKELKKRSEKKNIYPNNDDAGEANGADKTSKIKNNSDLSEAQSNSSEIVPFDDLEFDKIGSDETVVNISNNNDDFGFTMF